MREADEAALGHGLGIKAGRLLLHRAKWRSDDKRWVATCNVEAFGHIKVGDQRNAESVVEGDFSMIDTIRFRECFVPGEFIRSECNAGSHGTIPKAAKLKPLPFSNLRRSA